jgi:hypothetical protein
MQRGRQWLAGTLGAVAVALPAAGLVLATLPAHPHAAGWLRTPGRTPPSQPARSRTWDRPSQASLALLRRVTAREARRSIAALRVCEARARARPAPGGRYRRCATAPLARASAFAAMNSRMLASLVIDSGATRACNSLVQALANDAGWLSQLAGNALHGGGQGDAWPDLLGASRSIRGMARETVRLARGPDWKTTCRPRRPAKPSGPAPLIA